MERQLTRRRMAGLLVVALLAASAGLALHGSAALSWLERDTVDARFSLRGGEAPSRKVVIVGIDNDSLAALPRYPFSRRLHARVIERLRAAGARLIVYDISFDSPTTPAADEALLNAAARGAPVVFATSLISSSGATEVLGGEANLRALGDQAAAADMLPDGDGVVRHTLDQVNGLPTVAGAVARRLGVARGSVRQLHGGWIDFPGPPGVVRTIPFLDVLQGHFDRSAVRGKVVVVGATASVLQDLHSTSVGSPMSGPEVQADAISTVLDGFRLRSPPAAVTALLIVLLALLVPIAGIWLGSLTVAMVGFATIALWTVVSQLAFEAGIVVDYSAALVALLLATGATMMLGMWAERRERAKLRAMFAAGSGEIVEQVLDPAGSRALEPTAIIAGYKIEQVVGRGGMGVVYRASQLALGRAVAVKLITPERSHDGVFRERFKSESLVAASIEHANVIPVYEAGEDDGLLFIAMRLVDGIDLAQLLTREGPLARERAVSLIGQLAGALDAAHARGLVHRDVKPANALVTFDRPEHVYLTDFGVAMHIGGGAGLTRPDQWIGTLDYLAPEQIDGQGVGASADIYALTGVLYHCLAGEIPFPRENELAKLWAHVNAEPPSVSPLRPDLPHALDEVIARGMAKDPATRFATAGEMAVACAQAVGVPFAGAGNASSVREPPATGQPPSGSTIVSEQSRPSGELAL